MEPCTLAVVILLLVVMVLLFIAISLMDSRARIHEELSVCRERLAWMRRKDRHFKS